MDRLRLLSKLYLTHSQPQAHYCDEHAPPSLGKGAILRRRTAGCSAALIVRGFAQIHSNFLAMSSRRVAKLPSDPEFLLAMLS